MIEYIGVHAPEIDEEKLHYNVIKNLMSRYKKIVLIAPFTDFMVQNPGEHDIIGKIREKYSGTDWSFYFTGRGSFLEPYIYVCNDFESAPNADVYYIIQYSTEYKEAITGIRFVDGFPRPMSEYHHARTWYEMSKLQTKLGRVYKSKTELRKLVR